MSARPDVTSGEPLGDRARDPVDLEVRVADRTADRRDDALAQVDRVAGRLVVWAARRERQRVGREGDVDLARRPDLAERVGGGLGVPRRHGTRGRAAATRQVTAKRCVRCAQDGRAGCGGLEAAGRREQRVDEDATLAAPRHHALRRPPCDCPPDSGSLHSPSRAWPPRSPRSRDRTLDRIRATGTITFGYRDDAAPFSFQDRDGRVRGYSVELCEQAAARDRQGRRRVPRSRSSGCRSTRRQRLDAVASGEVDAECGTTTITLVAHGRASTSACRSSSTAAACSCAPQSKLARLADLKGKRVAVIAGHDDRAGARAHALGAASAPATLVPVETAPRASALLARGKVDGYAGDRIVLATLQPRAPKPRDARLPRRRLLVRALRARRAARRSRFPARGEPRARRALPQRRHRRRSSSAGSASLGRPGPLLHAMFYLNAVPE